MQEVIDLDMRRHLHVEEHIPNIQSLLFSPTKFRQWPQWA
jgi:hypothetical protein